MNVYETRRVRSERRRALIYLGELYLIAGIEFVMGFGALWGTPPLALLLVFLSVLTIFFGAMAAAYFESVRPRGDRPTRVQEVLWAAPKLRLYTLLANAGLLVGITVIFWIVHESEFVVVPAAVLLAVGLRVIFLARDYHRARVRELESRE